MSLQLLPMVEEDLDACLDIFWAAFSEALMGLMFPKGYTKAVREYTKEAYIREWRGNPDRIKMMKVIDTALPTSDPRRQIVGVSKWKFFKQFRTAADFEAEKKQEDIEDKVAGPMPDCNEPMIEAFGNAVSECKAEYLGGKPHCLLHILAVAPEHHRRGVGAMILNWGLDEADRFGLPVYLEASQMGRPLYNRVGFEDLKAMPFDGREWGWADSLEHTCMLRPAQAKKMANGVTNGVPERVQSGTPSMATGTIPRAPNGVSV